jgi:hypothetical protein
MACPVCLKVFIVSGPVHRDGRACPKCGKAKAFVSQDGKKASVECKEGDILAWSSSEGVAPSS